MNKVEIVGSKNEFEQVPGREIERKFMPVFPELLDSYREQAIPVEQFYLSHPSERFSLRLRETVKNGELSYSATFKDKGTVTSDGLDRLEENVDIQPQTYAQYRTADVPVIRKLRAEPMEHIAIDFFEDGDVRLESENPQALASFLQQTGLESTLVDVTGDRFADNQFLAQLAYRRLNGGREANVPGPELDSQTIIADLLSERRENGRAVAQIGGRSGSGKSTITYELRRQLEQHGIPAVILSTDDYNIGKTAAERLFAGAPVNWDHPLIYDTAELARDIARLMHGEPIRKRTFDFDSQQPVYGDMIQPGEVYLIEGLYATSSDFAHLAGRHYQMPTSITECIGRRLYRDHYNGERALGAFKTASDTLRHIIEVAEPTYREYQPQRNTQGTAA